MDYSDEEWKPVVGYEGIYEVSSLGRMKSVRRRKSIILSPCVSSVGYYHLDLWKDRKRQTVYVHRLVAVAFIGPIPKDYMVNHKNFIKTDNRVFNLEIITEEENIAHFLATGRQSRGVLHHDAKLNNDLVRAIRRRWKAGESMASLSREYGVYAKTIWKVVHLKTWNHVS